MYYLKWEEVLQIQEVSVMHLEMSLSLCIPLKKESKNYYQLFQCRHA